MTSTSSAGPSDQLAGAYDSPRSLGFGGLNLTGLWTLYVLTLRQHLHGKRWMIMVVLFLLPAALADLVRLTAPREVPSIGLEFMFVFMLIPHAILPLVALIYATGIIQDEQEDQTITYLLIRPLPKWAIYIVKLLATLTTTVALTCVFTALTYVAIYVGAGSSIPDIPLRCLKAASIHSLSVVSYCCLFGLMSLLTKRVLVAGILYIVAIEGVVANLPLSIRLITIMYYTRLIAYRSLDFLFSQYGRTENISAEMWHFEDDPKLLEHPTMHSSLIVLLVASLVCTILAAIICSRREFHVKTPGKD